MVDKLIVMITTLGENAVIVGIKQEDIMKEFYVGRKVYLKSYSIDKNFLSFKKNGENFQYLTGVIEKVGSKYIYVNAKNTLGLQTFCKYDRTHKNPCLYHYSLFFSKEELMKDLETQKSKLETLFY